MPKLLKTLYDVSDKDANNAADQERKERTAMIDRYWSYYWGNHPKPLKIEAGMDDNVILNLCQMVIDKKVAFLLPDDLKITLPMSDDAPNESADDPTVELIEAWLDNNNFPQFAVDMAISGMIAGHNFVKLYIADDGLYFSLLDPRQVVVFWRRGLSLEPAWYNIQWSEGDTNYRQDIVPTWMFTPQEGDDIQADQWIIIDYELNKGGKWEELARDVWAYPFPPVVDWKNKFKPFAYYGESDLTHYALNDAVNYLASNTNKIIRFHASPRTVLKGFAKMPRDPMTGDHTPYNPNQIIEIGENDDLYIVEPAADLVSSMTLLEKLQNMFFTQAKVIDLATIQDKLGQITNFGVKMMFSDMLADLRQKQGLYGTGLAWLVWYGMVIQEVNIPLPVIQWPDPLPENMLEKAQIAQIEKNIGTASTQTLSEELGHDWATEEERLAVDAEQSASALDRVMQGQGQFLGNDNANGSQP